MDSKGEKITLSHEWCDGGVIGQKERLKRLFKRKMIKFWLFPMKLLSRLLSMPIERIRNG
jgi:hypothetical protein